ncbi:MAG: type II toxin-antitoxin system RelE/ParE family toxin [Planctomycetes bacterium]|nr:type II toxin-antitoxin system RelE/ParE family toxin [Planctomycetota bacterium]
MAYEVEIDNRALKALKLLSKSLRRQISKKIDSLKENPYPASATKIQGQENIWRVRKGNYRIAYAVIENKLLILVVHIGDRKSFYNYFKRVKFKA